VIFEASSKLVENIDQLSQSGMPLGLVLEGTKQAWC